LSAPSTHSILHHGSLTTRIRSRKYRHRKIRLRPDYRGQAHPVIPRERDLFPSLAEPGCAAQAAAFGGRASSAGVGARGPAVRQGSAREAVGSAFLVQAYAEFTGVADLEQADQGRTISDSNRISRR